ncbi:MAG: class I adenylate-forming enzyme family protein [Steroidobacteraceae bacterium]
MSGHTVHERFQARAALHPDRPALIQGSRVLDYAAVGKRVEALAAQLAADGGVRGERGAVLAENCLEYLLVQLAAAHLGAMVACLNYRLTAGELADCLEQVEPRLLLHTEKFAELAKSAGGSLRRASLPDYVATAGQDCTQVATGQPEDGLLIIFTSGTTGTPKAAVISQRAEVARMQVLQRDLGLDEDDAFIAWAPMFHMGGSEHSLSSLMYGASVVVIDGLDAEAIVEALVTRKVGWLLLVPATLEPVLEELRRRNQPVRGLKVVGCMADMVSRSMIEAICRATGAAFLNSFGSTETGLPPLSAGLLRAEQDTWDLGKRANSGCELMLREATDGVGEMLVRGPTLFSGYWREGGIDRSCLIDGAYPMGDLFRQRSDGLYEFAGRSKYLIKSGGENIYPAEIEGPLLADPRIEEAIVVRKPDERWGEVPVLFLATSDPSLAAAQVLAMLEPQLARYKLPREVRFVKAAELPRNTSGKVMREQLEKWATIGP